MSDKLYKALESYHLKNPNFKLIKEDARFSFKLGKDELSEIYDKAVKEFLSFFQIKKETYVLTLPHITLYQTQVPEKVQNFKQTEFKGTLLTYGPYCVFVSEDKKYTIRLRREFQKDGSYSYSISKLRDSYFMYNFFFSASPSTSIRGL